MERKDKMEVEFFVLGEEVIEPLSENANMQSVQEIIKEPDQVITIVQLEIEDNISEKSEKKMPGVSAKPTKRFACSQCPARYTRNYALKKHVNSMHLMLKVE